MAEADAVKDGQHIPSVPSTSGQSTFTENRIADARARFNPIRQLAPMYSPPNRPTSFLGPIPESTSQTVSIGSTIFAGLAIVTGRQITPLRLGQWVATIGRIYVTTAMRPIATSIRLLSSSASAALGCFVAMTSVIAVTLLSLTNAVYNCA